MPTLKYLGDSYGCATAIKGANYIHLLDENGVMVAAFDKISDFSKFTLENGSYTSPTADHDCYLAVIREDGTLGKGGHKCSDIPVTAADVDAVPTSRKVNGKTLGADISLVASDVGARPATWMPSAAEVGARPNTWVPTADEVTGCAKIATGSYVGNGKYYPIGTAETGYKNTLTFPFVPKLVTITGPEYSYGGFVWVNGASSGHTHGTKGVMLEWSGNTLSWYSFESASEQLNAEGQTYCYTIIG